MAIAHLTYMFVHKDWLFSLATGNLQTNDWFTLLATEYF